MSATAALSASIVGAYAAAGSEDYVALTATLAIVTGVLAILAGLLRFGFLASFISEPVLKGFIVGLALTIIAGQLPKLFGVEKTEGNFFQQIAGLVRELGATNAADPRGGPGQPGDRPRAASVAPGGPRVAGRGPGRDRGGPAARPGRAWRRHRRPDRGRPPDRGPARRVAGCRTT